MGVPGTEESAPDLDAISKIVPREADNRHRIDYLQKVYEKEQEEVEGEASEVIELFIPACNDKNEDESKA